jgi:hypothetical protein
MFTPSFIPRDEHTLLYTVVPRREGRTKDLHSLWTKFAPRGEMSHIMKLSNEKKNRRGTYICRYIHRYISMYLVYTVYSTYLCTYIHMYVYGSDYQTQISWSVCEAMIALESRK